MSMGSSGGDSSAAESAAERRHQEQIRLTRQLEARARAERLAQAEDTRKSAAETRAREDARQGRISEGISRVNRTFDQTFSPDFFAGVRQSYLDQAMPEIDRQYDDTKRNLEFALARSGTASSSESVRRQKEAERLLGESRRNAIGVADEQAKGMRTAVEGARNNAVLQAQSVADPITAQSLASARIPDLQVSPSYNPPTTNIPNAAVGLIGAIGEGLAGILAQQRRQSAYDEIDTALGMKSGGSGRVVGG